MRYTRLATKIWTDEKFRTLDATAQRVFLYLLSCPHGNMCGFFLIPGAYATYDLQIDAKAYDKAIQHLIKRELVIVEKDVVLLPNFLKYNPLRGANQIKGATTRLKELPATNLIDTFLTHLREYTSEEDYSLFVEIFEPPSKPLVTPFEAPSNADTDTETDTGTDTETDTDTISSGKNRLQTSRDNGNQASDVKEIFDYHVSKTNKQYRLTDKLKTHIKARLKVFSMQELKSAVDSMLANQFMTGGNETNTFYATPQYLFKNDDNVDKWLQSRNKPWQDKAREWIEKKKSEEVK